MAFAPPAKRALQNELPLTVVDAVLAFAGGDLADEPRRVGKPMRAPLTGHWTARRGAYRIIYTIDDDQQLIRILNVDHRSDVYRP